MVNPIGLEIVLKLNDKFTPEFNKSVNSLKSQVDKASESFVHLGREISQAGRNMTFLGAAITGPMVLAFKTTSNYTIEASDSLKRLSAAAIEFQTNIGMAMLPVVEKVTRVIENLNQWFKSLDKQTRNNFIQFALLTGIFLTIIGPLMNIIGRMAKLLQISLAFTVVHPVLLAIVASIALMIIFWDKLRVVAIPILNAIEYAIDVVALAWAGWALLFWEALAEIANGLQFVLDMFAKLPGPQQAFFQGLATSTRGATQWFNEMSQSASDTVTTIQGHMANLVTNITTTQGLLVFSIEEFKKFMDDISNLNFDKINTSLQTFAQNFSSTFKQAYDNAVNIGAQSAQILISQANTFSAGFGKAFSNMILHGKNFGESMKQVFEGMLEALIAAIVQMLVQWAIYAAFTPVILAASAALATGVAAAWATAAAFVSLATFGANAGPAAAAITSITALAQGLAAIPKLAEGGILGSSGSVMVGERGPEILSLPSGARVTPLDKSSGGVSVHIENAYMHTQADVILLAEQISRLTEEKRRSGR